MERSKQIHKKGKNKFWLVYMCEKQKSCLITYPISWKICLFSCKTHFQPFLCLDQPKASPKKRNWCKMQVFRYLPAITKGFLYYKTSFFFSHTCKNSPINYFVHSMRNIFLTEDSIFIFNFCSSWDWKQLLTLKPF